MEGILQPSGHDAGKIRLSTFSASGTASTEPKGGFQTTSAILQEYTKTGIAIFKLESTSNPLGTLKATINCFSVLRRCTKPGYFVLDFHLFREGFSVDQNIA